MYIEYENNKYKVQGVHVANGSIIIVDTTHKNFLIQVENGTRNMPVLLEDILYKFNDTVNYNISDIFRKNCIAYTVVEVLGDRVVGLKYSSYLGVEIVNAKLTATKEGEVVTVGVEYRLSDGVYKKVTLTFLRIDLDFLDIHKDEIVLKYTEHTGVYTLEVDKLKYTPFTTSIESTLFSNDAVVDRVLF